MPRLVFSAVAALIVTLSCSSGGPKSPAGDGGSSGGADAGASGGGGGGSSNSGGKTGTGGLAFTCSQLGFKASGVTCPASGCGSFRCSCADGFPKSITSCTGSDGCLISADCDRLCEVDLGRALDCTDTYSVVLGTGGAGTGGSGGASSGTGGAPPACSAEHVRVPAASAKEIGSTPLTYPKLLGDESGALYVASTVGGNTDLDVGGGPLPGGTHLVLFKLDTTHAHVWSRRFGSELSIERVTAFRFARNGDLLVAGFTGRKVNLGGGPTPETTPAQVFVARYDRSGSFVRGYLAPGPATGDVLTPSSVAETPAGDILLFGSFAKPWDVGGGTLTPAGDKDVFILRFATNGTLSEAKRFGRSGSDDVFDAAVAEDGSIYLLGFAYVALDLGKDPIDLGTDQFSSYVARLDTALSPVWQRRVGAGAYPRRLFLNGTTLVTAGDMYSDVWYADETTGALPRGHAFLLRIDTASGDLLKGHTYASTGFGARVTALVPMPNDGVAIGGYIQAPADFGGGPLVSISSYQPFLAELNGAGEHVLSTLFCTTQIAGGAEGAVGGIARDGDSTVLVAPYTHDMELGSVRITGDYGSLLVDMPPLP